MEKLVRTTVRLPEDLFKRAKVRAIEDNKSLQELITNAVERYIRSGDLHRKLGGRK